MLRGGSRTSEYHFNSTPASLLSRPDINILWLLYFTLISDFRGPYSGPLVVGTASFFFIPAFALLKSQ